MAFRRVASSNQASSSGSDASASSSTSAISVAAASRMERHRVSSARPRPYASSVEANVIERLHPTRGKLYTGPAILHTLSRRDAVNPYAQGVQLAAALGGDLMEHGGGHVVPVRDLGGEIADWVRAHSAADYGVPV